MTKVSFFKLANLAIKLTAVSSLLSLALTLNQPVYAQASAGASAGASASNPSSQLTPQQLAALKAARFAALPPIQQVGYKLKNASEEQKQQKASSLAGLPFTASTVLDTNVSNLHNEMYLRDFVQPGPAQKYSKLLCRPKFYVDGQIRSNVMLGAYRQQANQYDLNFNLYHRYFKLGAAFTMGNYHYVVPTNPDLVSKNYNKGGLFLAQADIYDGIALTYELGYQYFNNKVNRQYKLFDKPYSFNHEYSQYDFTNGLFISKNFMFDFIVPNQVITPFFGYSYTASRLPLVTEDLGGYRLEVAKQTVDHSDLLAGFTYSYTVSNFNLVLSYSYRYQLNERKALEAKLTDDKTNINLDFKKFDQRYEQTFGLKASYTYAKFTFGGQITLMNYVDFESSYGGFIKFSY